MILKQKNYLNGSYTPFELGMRITNSHDCYVYMFYLYFKIHIVVPASTAASRNGMPWLM